MTVFTAQCVVEFLFFLLEEWHKRIKSEKI